MAQFKETLRTGDSEARYQALTKIGHNQKWVEILNDSFLPVLQTVSVDPDRRVRNEVASLAGYRWLWVTPAQPQDPSVIELMLQLSADSDRQVRYNAVYYGLSAVRDKSEPVVRRLIQLATTDPDTDLFGRIAWSLKHSLNTSRQLFERTWAGELRSRHYRRSACRHPAPLQGGVGTRTAGGVTAGRDEFCVPLWNKSVSPRSNLIGLHLAITELIPANTVQTSSAVPPGLPQLALRSSTGAWSTLRTTRCNTPVACATVLAERQDRTTHPPFRSGSS